MKKLLLSITTLLCLSAMPAYSGGQDHAMEKVAARYNALVAEGHTPDEAADMVEPLRMQISATRLLVRYKQDNDAQRLCNYGLGLTIFTLTSVVLALLAHDGYCSTEATCELLRNIAAGVPIAGISTLLWRCMQNPQRPRRL